MSRIAPWIVVGGGASGLAAAFFLKQRGLDSVVIERDSAIGGRMGTVQMGERTLDCGGKNIGRGYTFFRRFVASLGTHPMEHFGLNSSQVVDGQIRTFDASARWSTMASLARGIAASDAIRFGRVLWRVKRDQAAGYLGSPYSRQLAAKYDTRPMNRYFSPAFCDRFLRPMTVRMNGAEPNETFMGSLPANVRMILDSYEQFTHGLAPLLNAFAARYEVRVNTVTEKLLVEDGRVVGVQARGINGAITEIRGAGVILATPAHAAATLTVPFAPALADHLRSVTYYPVTLAIAEYDRPIFTATVRAFVFDDSQPLSNAGAYGINDLHLVRYTFSGRRARHLTDDSNAGALVDIGEAALAKHIAVDRCWRRRAVAKRFSAGLCAYTANHGRFLDGIASEAARVDGLYLTGDYMQGASIEACFRSASACVDQLAKREQLSQRPTAAASPELNAVPIDAVRHGASLS